MRFFLSFCPYCRDHMRVYLLVCELLPITSKAKENPSHQHSSVSEFLMFLFLNHF